MKKPNLLIIGAQKCGTTWLHKALDLSSHIYGTKPKELHYWNKKKRAPIDQYFSHFSEAPDSAKYLMESTPNYFKIRKNFDIAKDIREGLGDIPLILLVRNPVDRYLSAYTHVMMKGRVPIVEEITEVDHNFNLAFVEFGYYGKNLEYYQKYFSNIKVYFHEDMVKDRDAFVQKVFNDLNIEIDFPMEDLDFRANDKNLKVKAINNKKNSDIQIEKLPQLSSEVESELKRIYLEDIELFEGLTGRNLDHWK